MVVELIDNPLFVEEEIPLPTAAARVNRIQSVTGRTFEIHNGARNTESFRSHLLLYNEAGRKNRQERYNRAGKTVYEWIYDEQGRLLRERAYRDSGEINYQIETIYDHGDQWIEKRMSLPDGRLQWRLTASRDAKGRLVREGVYHDAAGQIIRIDSYMYDDHGRLITISMGPLGAWSFEYDDAGNLKKKTGDLPSSSLFGETFEFHYDNRGLLVERNHLNHEVTVFDYGLIG